MNKFKVGDKVIVTTTRHGKSQYGLKGEVTSIKDDDCDDENEYLPYLVVMPSSYRNSYHYKDLQLLTKLDQVL